MSLLGVVVAFPVVLLATFHLMLRRTMSGLSHFAMPEPPGLDPPPAGQAAARAALESAGYVVEVSTVASLPGQGRQHISLLRHADGQSLAEVSTRVNRSRRVGVSLMSCVGDLLLSTQTTQGLITAEHELKQVFAGADAAALVAEHQRALAALTARGVAVSEVAPGTGWSWWAEMLRGLGRDHPNGLWTTIRAAAIALGRTEDAGSLLDRPGGTLRSPA